MDLLKCEELACSGPWGVNGGVSTGRDRRPDLAHEPNILLLLILYCTALRVLEVAHTSLDALLVTLAGRRT